MIRSLLRRMFPSPSARPRRTRAYCTLATREFLPQVHALVESLRSAMPEARAVLLFVTRPGEDPAPPAWQGLEIIGVRDLVDTETERILRRRYSLGEFCFSLKPFLMRWMLARTDEAVYLDADTVVYAPLEELHEALRESMAVVTPHLDAPLPEDGKLPTEMTMLRSGLYNMGVFGVRGGEPADAFLEWWTRRVTRWGFVEPSLSYLGDQRWMDLAPVFFPDVAVLRHRGYNVGYWNLHSRRITGTAQRARVNGEPLAIFHYSGFDADKPAEMSRYQNRFRMADNKVTAALFADYAARVATGSAFVAKLSWPAPGAPAPAQEPPDATAAPGAYADEQYRAQIECQVPAGVVEMGEEIVLPVTVRNASDSPWQVGKSADGSGGIALSWHLYDEQGRTLIYDNRRFPLRRDLPAGASESLEAAIRMPGVPGHYIVELDLVHEGVTWFATRGSQPRRIWIAVGLFPREGAG